MSVPDLLSEFSATTPQFLVHALEQRAGWTASSRFAGTVRGLILGNFDLDRYVRAGQARVASGATDAHIEQDIRDWLAGDLNPVYRFLMSMSDPHSLVRGVNAFNARYVWEDEADELEKTTAMPPSSGKLQKAGIPRWVLRSGKGDFRLEARRVGQIGFEDPEACKVAALSSVRFSIEAIEQSRASASQPAKTLSAAARHFGVEGMAHGELAMLFERMGCMPIAKAAAVLGCHRRTLQRQLQALGVTFESIVQAHRLANATARLHGPDSLTRIAAEEGYSDLAHMTRSFSASCGMSPSALRKSGAFDIS